MDILITLVPDQVGQVIVTRGLTAGQPSLNISWDMPSSDRPILYYEIERRINGTDVIVTTKANFNFTTVTLDNLLQAANYIVRVRAVSDVGSGPWSDTVNETTCGGM